MHYGIIGSAFAELFAYSLYNFIRFEFLRRKFNMQPFDHKTLLTFVAAAVSFGVPYFIFQDMEGWMPIILRTLIFSGLFIISVFKLALTPDAGQLYHNFMKRFAK